MFRIVWMVVPMSMAFAMTLPPMVEAINEAIRPRAASRSAGLSDPPRWTDALTALPPVARKLAPAVDATGADAALTEGDLTNKEARRRTALKDFEPGLRSSSMVAALPDQAGVAIPLHVARQRRQTNGQRVWLYTR